MKYDDSVLDEILEEFLDEDQEPEQAREREVPRKRKKKEPKKKKRSGWRRFWAFLGGFLLVLVETVLLLAVALYGVMYVLAKGPSPTARDLFVMSVRETSAVGFLANLYFTDEEIAEIEKGKTVEEFQATDTSLINIPKPEDNETQTDEGPVADAWGLVDEDGDGIIIEDVKGEGYAGYMMVVLDPSRVIVGSVPNSYGSRGYYVSEMIERFGGVAGVNAGGFHDPNGSGNGSIPNSLVVFEGKSYYSHLGTYDGFMGIDSNHVLHVATTITEKEVKERDIQYGVSFGPVLISNGEANQNLVSGVNPRTAIGQRSDGAILLLVIDGRQAISLGASLADLVEIMEDYGAVNACNLDGGSSSLMWYQDEYINSSSALFGERPVPTSIVVLAEGADDNG